MKKTVSYDVTVCKTVPVEKVKSCTVMVPYQVEKEVQVQVCKMVPKTIQVPVWPFRQLPITAADYRRYRAGRNSGPVFYVREVSRPLPLEPGSTRTAGKRGAIQPLRPGNIAECRRSWAG